VGASGWDYRTPYRESVENSIRSLQESVIASGQFIWPWEEFDDDYLEDGEALARPSSLEELIAAKEEEDFWDGGGTHSILDLVAGDLTPLSASELVAVFGSEQPTAADLERVHEPGPGGALGDLMSEKWTGRSLVVFADDQPAEVYVWGWSGD